jgi:hypothetical protein
MFDQSSRRFISLTGILFMFVLAVGSAPARAADAKAKPTKTAPIPAACQDKPGVEQKICVQCGELPIFKRIGCEQRVFWTTCKGMRLVKDPYCQMHQDKGPPAPVGG